MTVDYIIPCVCCTHPPSVDDSVSYGMPILEVQNSLIAHQQFWSFRCPSCGRGGNCLQFKSPYLAMKNWNEMQRSLYETAKKPIIYEESWKDTCARLGYEYDERLEYRFWEDNAI